MRWPKPSKPSQAIFPPQARSLDKGHGRIEERKLCVQPTDPETIGLAGARQLLRAERIRQTIRKGHTINLTTEIVYAVTSLPPEKTTPKKLLKLLRSHWAIENGQHHRRDRTQDEDRCQVKDPAAAQNLSLLRSLAIFIYEQQRGRSKGKKSLPDFERHVLSHPSGMIGSFMNE
jgi:predicted transposase YbfD/YdcC